MNLPFEVAVGIWVAVGAVLIAAVIRGSIRSAQAMRAKQEEEQQ
jgi:hypothetical protein